MVTFVQHDLRSEHLLLPCVVCEGGASFKAIESHSSTNVGTVYLYDDGMVDPQVSHHYVSEAYNRVAEYAKEHNLTPHMRLD